MSRALQKRRARPTSGKTRRGAKKRRRRSSAFSGTGAERTRERSTASTRIRTAPNIRLCASCWPRPGQRCKLMSRRTVSRYSGAGGAVHKSFCSAFVRVVFSRRKTSFVPQVHAEVKAVPDEQIFFLQGRVEQTMLCRLPRHVSGPTTKNLVFGFQVRFSMWTSVCGRRRLCIPLKNLKSLSVFSFLLLHKQHFLHDLLVLYFSLNASRSIPKVPARAFVCGWILQRLASDAMDFVYWRIVRAWSVGL